MQVPAYLEIMEHLAPALYSAQVDTAMSPVSDDGKVMEYSIDPSLTTDHFLTVCAPRLGEGATCSLAGDCITGSCSGKQPDAPHN